MKYSLITVLLMILLSGCASNIPVEIRQDITDGQATVNNVRNDFEQYAGRQVRWGGTIAAVENNQDDTWIVVVGRELNSWGEPEISDQSTGRFIVRFDGFLDPAIYKIDRGITVYGTIESRVVREIDEHPYDHALVKAQSHYLWNDYEQRRRFAAYPYRHYYPPYYYPYYFGHWYGHHPAYGFGLRHHLYW